MILLLLLGLVYSESVFVIKPATGEYSRLIQQLSSVFTVDQGGQVKLFSAYGERSYDHVAILDGTLGGATPAALLDFLADGGNLLLSGDMSDQLRDFALEFSIDFDDRLSLVHDPLHVEVKGTATGTILNLPLVVQDAIAHRLTGRNPLVIFLSWLILRYILASSYHSIQAFSALTASPSAYSFPRNAPGKKLSPNSPFIGSSISLVSALQTRGNARVLFCGSSQMFSDALADSNAAGVKMLTDWVFQQRGRLRVLSHLHSRQALPRTQHGIYRIRDNMTYSVSLQQYNNGWEPYVANDVQFAAKMLDDYVRLNMTPRSDGYYEVNFTLPDVYGVFTFEVSYWRHGLTFLDVADTVQVRPFRHDDYPRFLSSAWVYYINVASLMAGFVCMSAVWLFHRTNEVEASKKDN